MAFNLVLPQMLPCTELFGTLFARILHSSIAVCGVLFQHVVTYKPLCYSYQTANNNRLSAVLYMDI